jgi:hypothetical protein
VQAFVSHTGEEAPIALTLRAAIDRDFLGILQVFVSAETEDVGAGENWLQAVEAALQDSSIFLVLCSPTSISRPWINFEAGAAWILGTPIIPLCHAGLARTSYRYLYPSAKRLC